MLVLVAVRNFWFAQPLLNLSLVTLILGVVTSPLLGQTGDRDSDAASSSVSVLVKPASSEGVSSQVTNESVKIEGGSASNSAMPKTRSFEASLVFPNGPMPPKELLMPQSPDQDSFTKPVVSSEEFANELRSSSHDSAEDTKVVSASFDSPAQDRSKAIGTLATTSQNRQHSPSFQTDQAHGSQVQISQFSRPSPDNAAGPRKTLSLPIVSRFGDSSGASRRPSTSTPSVAFQSFSNAPNRNSSSGSKSASNSDSGPAASNWRRPVPGQANQNSASNLSNRTASNQPMVSSMSASSGSRFNANANSNYNQGVNPNIAYGVPQVAPLQPFQTNQNIANQAVRRTQQSFNRDSLVQPTGFTQLTAPRKAQTALAKRLIARYSVDGVSPQELAGQPVKLFEMLSQPISTEQRRPMVHQFWDTYLDWASLVNSRQYLRLLDDIPGSSSETGAAMLEMAKMEAKNEVLASEIELVKSQSKLTQYLPNRSSSLPPPIPNDLPLIQKYNTQYERYRQYQLMPVNLLGIDKMLPKTLELIASRAETVQMAQSANQKIVAGVRNRQASVSDALSAAKAWRSAEQNLLIAVMDYNHAICDYSLTVSRGYQSPQQVVGMLIAKPKATNSNDGSVADRFRDARNLIGGSQPVPNSRPSNQRFNQSQNNLSQPATPASNRLGSLSSDSSNSSGFNQSGGSSQIGFQSGTQNQRVSRTIEAGAASQFRSTSDGFGSQRSASSGSGSFNRNSSTASKGQQGFSLDSKSSFQPPAQKSFGGPSQFNSAPATSVQGNQPTPQSDPFGRVQGGSDRSANSQFQHSFSRQ